MEFELLTELIDKISNMLNLAVMNEFIIRKLHEEISMTFGIYYWSNEIMKSFGELTEKYLTKLLTHPLTKNQIEFIINWFSPSDSMVSNPIQHRKIFDIRSFVESTFGLPIIINYTWHEIYHELFNKNYTINSRFLE